MAAQEEDMKRRVRENTYLVKFKGVVIARVRAQDPQEAYDKLTLFLGDDERPSFVVANACDFVLADASLT